MSPGYVGSYCMDALSMALHLAYNHEPENPNKIDEK